MIEINFKTSSWAGRCLSVLIVIGIIAEIFILLGWIFSLLWNFAMPRIWFDAPMIDIWTGTAIVLIASIIFGCIKIQKVNKT